MGCPSLWSHRVKGMGALTGKPVVDSFSRSRPFTLEALLDCIPTWGSNSAPRHRTIYV